VADAPTFFTDRTISPEVGERLRQAGMVVEIHDEYFGSQGRNVESIEDEDWIPVIARKGWSIITNDKAMLDVPVERAALIRCGARLFRLVSGNLRIDVIGDVILRFRDAIERIAAEYPAPFAADIHEVSGVRLRPEHGFQPPLPGY
jgi:hypothetical protein